MATDLDDITVLRTRFLDTWDRSIPFEFEGQPLEAEPEGQVWARLTVIPGNEDRQSLISRTYLQKGRIYLQVMMPIGTGDETGWNAAQLFIDAFRDWHSDDYRVRCYTSEKRKSSESNYNVITVSIYYEAIH